MDSKADDGRVDVKIDLSDEVIAALDAEAAARGISRDDLINEVLKSEIAKYEKRIWAEDLKTRLNDVLADIGLNKVKYFICEDEELQRPTAVLIGMDEYELLTASLTR